MKILLVFLSLLASNSYSESLEAKLNQAGFNIDKGSSLILNQRMKDKKKKGDTYYLELACKHNKNFDKCVVSKVTY